MSNSPFVNLAQSSSIVFFALLPAMTSYGAGLPALKGVSGFSLTSVAFDARPTYIEIQQIDGTSNRQNGMSLTYLQKIRTHLAERLARIKESLSAPEAEAARRAIVEAMRFLNLLGHAEGMWYDINEEGVVLLRWRKSPDRGVLMLFQGDGTYNISAKGVGEFYFDQLKEHRINSDLASIRNLLVSL